MTPVKGLLFEEEVKNDLRRGSACLADARRVTSSQRPLALAIVPVPDTSLLLLLLLQSRRRMTATVRRNLLPRGPIKSKPIPFTYPESGLMPIDSENLHSAYKIPLLPRCEFGAS